MKTLVRNFFIVGISILYVFVLNSCANGKTNKSNADKVVQQSDRNMIWNERTDLGRDNW